MLMALLFSNCNNSVGEVEGHGHEEEEGVTLAYTLYSDKTELFVEFKPLVVGQKSKFAAHFTILGEKFLPLREGQVTVSLVIGDSGIRQTSEAASTPGIFHLALEPKKVGKGELIFDIQTKDYNDRIVISDIEVYSSEAEALKAPPQVDAGGDIIYLKEQAWKVSFAHKVAVKKPFRQTIKTSGQIISAPEDEVILTTQIGGIISFSDRNYVEGAAFQAGSRIFTVSNNDLEKSNISTALKQAEQELVIAEAQDKRSEELFSENIISEKAFLETKLRYKNALEAYDNISVNNNFHQRKQSIKVPITGYLKNLLVREGQYVAAGTPLAVLSRNNKLLLQVNISQKYFHLLPSIQSANFKTTDHDDYYNSEDLKGEVISYGKTVSEKSPFIPITFEVDNIKGLIPGSVAEVYLKSFPIMDAIVIPVSSLVEEQGTFFVYVQMGGESFEKREVKLAAQDGIFVQVLEGILEGERVVTEGALQIKLATAAGTMPAHGHVH